MRVVLLWLIYLSICRSQPAASLQILRRFSAGARSSLNGGFALVAHRTTPKLFVVNQAKNYIEQIGMVLSVDFVAG